MQSLHPLSKAGDVIFAHPTLITVFERLGIPLGVQDKSLTVVAEEQQIRVALLLCLLKTTLSGVPKGCEDLRFTDAPKLVEYLLKSHQFYSKEVYPRIAQLVEQLASSKDDSTFGVLKKIFTKYTKEVEDHFIYERDVAFPYIIELFQSENRSNSGDYRVHDYLLRHKSEDLEELLLDVQNLLIRHLPSAQEYSARRQLFLHLQALSDDLNIHMLIENEILVPLVEIEEAQWSSRR